MAEQIITTIRDILAMSVEDRKAKYRVDGKDKRIQDVIISGTVFTEYKAFSFHWEKVLITEYKRSDSGRINDPNSYATIFIPHLTIDFSLMSIESYWKFIDLIESANEFLVTCYDPDHHKRTTNKMVFTTEPMPKLVLLNRALNGEEWCELLGVENYTIDMVGSLNDVESITINYYLNSPTGTGQTTPIFSEVVALGSDIVLGQCVTLVPFDGYALNGWHQGSIDGAVHNDGDVFFVNKTAVNEDTNSISFYANWQDTNTYTLTYAYGLGEVQVDDKYMEITSKQVSFGDPIGTLPAISNPSVEYDGKIYYPYDHSTANWYKNSFKTKQILTPTTPYWLKASTTIYLLYDALSYRFNLLIDGDIYQENTAKYNSAIMLPNLKRKGYKFDGWYTDAFFAKKWSGNTMPPFDLILYARWVEE